MKKIFTTACVFLLSQSALAQDPIDHILFGSCGHQDKDMPILDSIIKDQPDLFLFLGDNIYGDTTDMASLADKYQKLGAKPRFQALKNTTPLLAIWDDHDFGENDAGKDYPQKRASRDIMLDFWQEPMDSERRSRDSGIYTSYSYNDPQHRVHVIMPDLRWNRDNIEKVSTLTYLTKRKTQNMGPYVKSHDPSASMLGETQWQWLENELRKPAKIKIIASSLQVLADFTGWEAWANFPHDINRLKRFIKDNKINGVVLISGDTHWGEVSYFDEGLDYPLWDVTSSGLTEEWKAVSPNVNRVGQYTNSVNYGAIDIDWRQPDPIVSLSLKDVNGDVLNQHRFSLSSISPYQEQ